MLLKNISALLGEELDFVSNVDIQIKNEKFQKIHSNIKSEYGLFHSSQSFNW